MSSFYSQIAECGDGRTLHMKDFEGKVVFATNVASKCGLTDGEYARFEKLGNKWGDDLVILGFPSREFGRQEFTTDEEIRAFADSKHFPGILMKLGHVTGPGASEAWKFFMRSTGSREPSWNFDGRFLVSKTGVVSLPTDLEVDIEALMAE